MRRFHPLLIGMFASAAMWAFVAASPAVADDVSVQVPGGDKLKIIVPDGWKHSVAQPVPTLPPTLEIQEPASTLLLKITFLPDPDGNLAKEEELKKLMKASTGLYVEGSVEKKLELWPLSTKNGRGFYATFTDASLVDKKELPPGQFRIVTSGILLVGKQAAAFTLLANRLEGKEYEAAMRLLTEGITLP